MTTLDRFMAKVVTNGDDDCWTWEGAKQSPGYGSLRVKGVKVFAHRFAFEQLVGPIPDGLFVCHTCDNPPCVNPAHLWLGTHAENMADCSSKGRARGKVSVGEMHPAAKLTERQVHAIRASAAPGNTLAETFGVSTTTVSAIRHRQIWKHID